MELAAIKNCAGLFKFRASQLNSAKVLLLFRSKLDVNCALKCVRCTVLFNVFNMYIYKFGLALRRKLNENFNTFLPKAENRTMLT